MFTSRKEIAAIRNEMAALRDRQAHQDAEVRELKAALTTLKTKMAESAGMEAETKKTDPVSVAVRVARLREDENLSYAAIGRMMDPPLSKDQARHAYERYLRLTQTEEGSF